ncbi:TPA: restriction endonuclease subunit S [Vibrio parahaemolyticus]|uniref:restriction endonuclease subunit S n=1 Tax=Vibrio parahaemolyticus TaxID=670 RepID=UPI00111FECB9|nr:restriction endonuclease subunit S [Vibrio parahaemolyticus]TOI59678.1 hypothetical protein CGI56_23270 [Vibrio parahaemolyticus]HCE1482457.1 restriction endonuclease subunit S [Vibrio parahaemolyticus]
MKGRYKAYSEYKDSGVEWLGKIPAHWVYKKLKWELSAKSGTDEKADGGIFPLYGANGIIGRTYTTSINLANETVIVGRVGSAGAITFVTNRSGISDNALIISNHKVDCPRFDYYLLQSQNLDELVSKNAQPLITASNIRDLTVVLPVCLEERRTIANFLDHETAKIDTLITKQEKLIELLKEKRQAVISHAVTKGLNPDAPMKDSGVEWLGEVPEHWKVANIGRISEVKRGSGYQNIDMEVGDNTSIKMLRISDMHAIKPALIVKNNEVVKFTVSAGDILVAGTGATAGISMVVPPECSGWVHSYNSIKVKVKSNVAESEFVQLFLTSDYISKLLDVSFVGSAQPFVDTNGLKKLRVLLPPKSEQKFIVNQLKEKLLRLDAVSSRAESLISLMKERKTALISAAVTGKIDVRDWQGEA